ncbi:uncharacterized protein LOC106652896 [Trichogramma pretiosum]|uniref:uncharacterized protein LOC106652896 n=1 Tax=Trichogramma pretiosum TaxID=7493 RepID=UPI0006C994C5|nr:uncharacterized protein LOC106652896 [Trichogramma pretiosum]
MALKSINLTLVFFIVFSTFAGPRDVQASQQMADFVQSIPEDERGTFLAYSIGLEILRKHLEKFNRTNEVDKYGNAWRETAKELLKRDDVPVNFASEAVEYVQTHLVLESDEYKNLIYTSERYAKEIQKHIIPNDDNISETCCPF